MKHTCVLLTLLLMAVSSAWGQRSYYYPKPNLNTYNDNMTVVCIVQKGGVTVTDCELAAFDANGVLRGREISDTDDRGVIYLTIQGEGRTDQLHFIAVTGAGVLNAIKETITFQANAVLGTDEDPYVFTIEGDLKGDINGDGFVNIVDLAILIDMLQGKLPTTSAADVNADSKYDMDDILILNNLIINK